MTIVWQNGFYDMPEDTYHADPAPEPSLSSSLANDRDDELAETAKREADIEHRLEVNNKAAVDLSVAVSDLEADFCLRVIKAIAQGKITNVKIIY
mgnify:CR=1 FL=1